MPACALSFGLDRYELTLFARNLADGKGRLRSHGPKLTVGAVLPTCSRVPDGR